jgi:hypothetical protein
MSGFFYKIRGLLRAEYSGRYLAVLLRELAFWHPETFAEIFELSRDLKYALKEKKAVVELEWGFEGRRQNKRRADLVILQAVVSRCLFSRLKRTTDLIERTPLSSEITSGL